MRFGIETKEPSPMRIGEAIDEIKALMDTPCPVMSRPQVKQAFMLSIFTYLSFADVLSLKWKDIKTNEGRTTIEVHSRKSSVPLTFRLAQNTFNCNGMSYPSCREAGFPVLVLLRLAHQRCCRSDMGRHTQGRRPVACVHRYGKDQRPDLSTIIQTGDEVVAGAWRRQRRGQGFRPPVRKPYLHHP